MLDCLRPTRTTFTLFHLTPYFKAFVMDLKTFYCFITKKYKAKPFSREISWF